MKRELALARADKSSSVSTGHLHGFALMFTPLSAARTIFGFSILTVGDDGVMLSQHVFGHHLYAA